VKGSTGCLCVVFLCECSVQNVACDEIKQNFIHTHALLQNKVSC
jgi:hypothetical protein